MILVDSNIVLDVVTQDPTWFDWSCERLAAAADDLAINEVIFAEVSVRYTRIEELDLFLARIWALRHNLTAYDAAYVALAETLHVPLVTCDTRLAASVGHRATIALG